MARKTLVAVAAAIACAAAGVAVILVHDASDPLAVAPDVETSSASAQRPAKVDPARSSRASAVDRAASVATVSESDAGAQPEAEERRAQEEERLVDTFDNLTDRWMEPAAKGVTMEDVASFVSTFSRVPSARREECLQRALNLVPDENVMLLAGILMDRSLPKECAELVFNDILNRSDEVKKPILSQVFKDKSHPCYADAAWILDVTGEKPD